jgi:hypothetical protein
MLLVQLAEKRREQGDRIHLLGRDLYGSAEIS